MATNSEWGKVEKLDIVPPITLIEEKAKIFNDNFPKGEMRCVVKKEMKTSEFDPFDVFTANLDVQESERDTVVRMYIEVPLLNNYRIQLLKVTYRTSELYPCGLENSIEPKTYPCDTMENFKSALNSVLVSESISKTLSILRTQIPD